MQQAQPIRTAPLALWRIAESFLHFLYNLFGAPETVAARQMLERGAHKLMASWLRAGEALMRRLLVIEAGAYPKPNTRALLWPKRKRARREVAFWPDKPEEWRVSFRSFNMDRRRPRRPTPAHAGEAPAVHKFYSAWPLAERYEALLRVFNDPTHYARRLARRLHATPHRLKPLLHAPPDTARRVENFDALTQAAESAGAVFNSS